MNPEFITLSASLLIPVLFHDDLFIEIHLLDFTTLN
jgi:hypothetical protein